MRGVNGLTINDLTSKN